MSAEIDSRIDEIDRVVLRLPKDSERHNWESYLAVAFDRSDTGSVQARLLAGGWKYLPFQHSYEIYSALCSDRAQRCVDHQLTVAGKTILPEQYLSLWRAAISDCKPLECVTAEYGLRLEAVLEWPRDALKGVPTEWTDCPFPTFDDFYGTYENVITVVGDCHRLELDLIQPLAVRNALFGERFLSDLRRKDQAKVYLQIHQTQAQPAQYSLTDTLEASHVVSN